MIDGEWQESYTFKPYEIMKIVIDSPLDWLYFPKISSNKGSFSNLPTGFLYSIDHQPPGTYTITMELWDLAGEDISSLFLADSVSRDFTLESDFNLNDVTIQAVPSMLRANQLEPVDLSLLIGNRSNIPGRAAGTVKITDPEGTVVLTREISSFETTPGKMEAVALDELADVFVKEGRYLIETTLIPEEDIWKPVSGKRYYDVFPADTLKITKTLTPHVLDPQNEGKVHVKIDLGSVSSFVEPPPVDLIFLIEESSNLRGEELARSKEIVCQLIDMLPSNARRRRDNLCRMGAFRHLSAHL